MASAYPLRTPFQTRGPPGAPGTIARCAMRKRLLLAAAVVAVLVAGLVATGLFLAAGHEDAGRLDTQLSGVSYEGPSVPRRRRERAAYRLHSRAEQPCWLQFGGGPRRALARLDTDLGPPTKPLWARGLDGYIEYPPVY